MYPPHARQPMKPLHIFKPGTHTAMSGASIAFSESDIAAMVRAYDPALHEAPLVIGHPKHDAPAAGWVKSLQATSAGLIAEPQQVDATFAEQVAKGSFKKISASFYQPDSPSNPVPGVYYLRHVGFLGAQPPAVKGLRAIELAEGEQGVVEFADFGHETSAGLWRRLRDWLIGERGLELADQIIPSWQIESLGEAARTDATPSPAFTEPTPIPDEATAVTEEQKAALEAENARLKTQLAQRENADREAAQAKTHSANVAFAEHLVASGMKPVHAGAVIAALDFAEAGDAPLEFGEGDDRQPLTEGLKAVFTELTGAVSFSERATKARATAATDKTSNPLLADAEARAQR